MHTSGFHVLINDVNVGDTTYLKYILRHLHPFVVVVLEVVQVHYYTVYTSIVV